MANGPKLNDSRLAEIRGIIKSEGERDRAQLQAVAAELLAEVDSLRLRIASQDQHIEELNRELLKSSEV